MAYLEQREGMEVGKEEEIGFIPSILQKLRNKLFGPPVEEVKEVIEEVSETSKKSAPKKKRRNRNRNKQKKKISQTLETEKMTKAFNRTSTQEFSLKDKSGDLGSLKFLPEPPSEEGWTTVPEAQETQKVQKIIEKPTFSKKKGKKNKKFIGKRSNTNAGQDTSRSLNLPAKDQNKNQPKQKPHKKRGGRNKIAKRIVFELRKSSNADSSNDVMNRNKNRKNLKNRKDQRKKMSPNNQPFKTRNMGHVKKKSIKLFDDTQSSKSNAHSVQDCQILSSRIVPVPPLGNLQELNNDTQSEQRYLETAESPETPEKEAEEKRLFDFDLPSQRAGRYSCKSVQNTG